MFYLPSTFNPYNEIIVRGEMDWTGRLNIALRNETVIVCQIDVSFPVNDQSEDKIELLPTPEDVQSYLASDYFVDMNFSVRFKAYEDVMSIFIEDSHLANVPLYHSVEDIKFISVNGRVKELTFRYP